MGGVVSSDELKEHQRENIDWIRRVGRGLLADQPGLGKSRSAIEAVDGLKTLVIAPNLVLEAGVWSDEVERWSADPSLYTFAPFTRLNDRITGPRGGSKPVKRLRPDYKGQGYEAVIVDEAHYIKGRDTIWVPMVEQVSATADIVVPMTGTPIPNWSHELYNILRLIHPEEAKRGTGALGGFWRWAKEWFDTYPSPYSNNKPSVGSNLKRCTPRCMADGPEHPCRHYQQFMEANLGDRWMRHLRDDCLDLPPLTSVDVGLSLDPEARRFYSQMKADFAADYRDIEVVAWSNGAKNVHLDKITTSPWLLAKDTEVPYGGKFDRLREDLRRLDSPVLLFAHYRDAVEGCHKVAESLGLRSAYIHGGTSDKHNGTMARNFQQGKLDVLVGSLETLSEGLTLTRAKTAIFVEHSFKPSRNEQAMYRIHRMGQTSACTIIRYVTERTVDRGKHRLLAKKTDHQMRMLTAGDFLLAAEG